jgi:hypothetical protein
MFGDKPVFFDEYKEIPGWMEKNHWVTKEVNVSFVPLVSFGYGRCSGKYKFIVISWLIFDCGIYW